MMNEPPMPCNYKNLKFMNIYQLKYMLHNADVYEPLETVPATNALVIWLKWRLNQKKIHKLIGK